MAKILHVDDDKSITEMLALCLEGEGHEMFLANDGKQGLEALLKFPGIQVIISDYNMPEMNGGEFVNQIKTNPLYAAYKSIPIIGLSSDFPQDVKGKLDAHFSKPFKYTLLDEEIKKLTGK